MSKLVRVGGLRLRDYTPARVSLATAGHSLATSEVLEFQLDHARARDAVHAIWRVAEFAERLGKELPLLAAANIEVLRLRSRAVNRAEYLRQPNLGRALEPSDAARLNNIGFDVVIVVADGLSALAVERNVVPVLGLLLPRMLEAGWTVGPIALVEQGRVGIGDEIGSLLGASMSVVLLGERPGLSAADSLGAYLTWQPARGRTDADRNCISNIRGGGLDTEAAADRLWWYLKTAQAQQRTGMLLKDGSPALFDGRPTL